LVRVKKASWPPTLELTTQLINLAIRAKTKKCRMQAVNTVASLLLKTCVQFFKKFMINLHGRPTHATDQVVMIVTGYLVHQLPTTHVSLHCDPLLAQETQRAVDRGFSHSGQYLLGTLVNF